MLSVPFRVVSASGSYHYEDVSFETMPYKADVSYLQILGRTVPDVHTLEIGIVALIERSPICVELVREL